MSSTIYSLCATFPVTSVVTTVKFCEIHCQGLLGLMLLTQADLFKLLDQNILKRK